MAIEVAEKPQQAAVAKEFVNALSTRDFERLQGCFQDEVRFRALVPSNLREGSTATEAVAWLQRWFGDADEFQVLTWSAEQIADRLHIAYRLRVHEGQLWYLVEQQAYCTLTNGLIAGMNLLCSGFRPDPEIQLGMEQSDMNNPTEQSMFGADAFFDAGSKGCAEGPLDEIVRHMRKLTPGQMLEVRATDPSVARDLPAWCRLVGHDLVNHEGDRYLIRHK